MQMEIKSDYIHMCMSSTRIRPVYACMRSSAHTYTSTHVSTNKETLVGLRSCLCEWVDTCMDTFICVLVRIPNRTRTLAMRDECWWTEKKGEVIARGRQGPFVSRDFR